jgi:hypothetical protein
MNKNTRKPLLAAVATYAAMLTLYFIATGIAKADNKFPVTKFEATQQHFTEDNRVVAATPEVWKVDISPALNFKMNKGNPWKAIGFIIILAVGAFMVLVALDKINFEKAQGNYVIWVGFTIAVACLIASYSSSLVSNYVELSREQYEAIKDSPDKLAELFTNKKLIQ